MSLTFQPKIEIKAKHLYILAAITAVALGGVYFSTAYGTNDPDKFGHTLSEVKGDLYIDTGTAKNGETLPVPNGFDRDQCNYMVSMQAGTDYGQYDGDHDSGYLVRLDDREVRVCWRDDMKGSRTDCKASDGWDDTFAQWGGANTKFWVNWMVVCNSM